MKTRITVLITILLLLLVSCTKGKRIAIVNQSKSPLKVKSIGRSYDCNVGQLVYFKPDLTSGYSTYYITIERAKVRLVYYVSSFDGLSSFEGTYVDGKHRRVVFAFRDDDKLYLIKPTDDPIHEHIGSQPPGYPLVSTNSADSK